MPFCIQLGGFIDKLQQYQSCKGKVARWNNVHQGTNHCHLAANDNDDIVNINNNDKNTFYNILNNISVYNSNSNSSIIISINININRNRNRNRNSITIIIVIIVTSTTTTFTVIRRNCCANSRIYCPTNHIV